MNELNTWKTISDIMNFTWLKKCKDNLSFSGFMYEFPVMKHTLNIRHNSAQCRTLGAHASDSHTTTP